VKRSIFTADHEAFRESCAAFIARHVTPHLQEYYDHHGIDRAFWLIAGAEGFLGLEVPDEYGGSYASGDYRFNTVLFEELSKVNAAISSCYGIHADIVTPYIAKMGNAEQQRRWLPGLASGRLLGALAMTEPGGGSDVAALRTSAVRDGDGWVINGAKTFITNGSSADMILTAVRTSDRGSRGITLFVLEATDTGFSRGRRLDKVGQQESDTAELFFTDLRVGDDRVLGEVDSGFVAMMKHLPQERLGSAVSNLAHAKAVLLETVEYARNREAFGRAIGAFQHNKFLLAELVTKIEVTEAYVDAAVMAHCAGELSPIDAAKAKWWSAETQNEVLDHCLQLHGGYGYMNEYRVARAWRDARVTKIWAGSNEIMKELIGRDLGFR
jgi:alkylation response protein AidB-like acyl-CoA dehydrogenase